MVAQWQGEPRVPPFVELTFGVKRRWFELALHAGVALGKMFDAPGTVIGLGASASFYSLRLEGFRLRHGIAVGVIGDAIFRRRPKPVSALPMPTARLSALDLLVRLHRHWWLEIMPLSFGWPLGYELALGIRYELPVSRSRRAGTTSGTRRAGTASGTRRASSPAGRAVAGPDGRPGGSASPVRFFIGLEMGLGWWHHHEPPVVGSAFGRLGLRYRWLEFALGVGSPAWGKWRARGFYEIFVDVGFYSLRRDRLRLRHRARLGLLFHNPPFEVHELGLVVHLDFCVFGLRIAGGLWGELIPLTLAVAPRDQLSTSVGLRYEF
jgi:hypothetical protein